MIKGTTWHTPCVEFKEIKYQDGTKTSEVKILRPSHLSIYSAEKIAMGILNKDYLLSPQYFFAEDKARSGVEEIRKYINCPLKSGKVIKKRVLVGEMYMRHMYMLTNVNTDPEQYNKTNIYQRFMPCIKCFEWQMPGIGERIVDELIELIHYFIGQKEANDRK